MQDVIKQIEARHEAKGKKIIVQVPADLYLHEILTTIASGCDGAAKKDGTGFNRNDLKRDVHGLISWLENHDKLTFNGLEWSLDMAVFYQKQWVKGAKTQDLLNRIKEAKKGLQDLWK